MKKILLISIISALFLTACGPKDAGNTNGSQDNESGENNVAGENITDVMTGDDTEIFKMSFEDRTKSFFDKKDEISGDRMKNDFNVIRLTKVGNHYELRANIIGDAKIGLKALEAGMNQVADKTLPSVDLELDNGDLLTIYGSRPQEIVEIYNELDAKRKWRQVYLDILAFEDSDWSRTMEKSVWINSDGVPMYTYFNGEYGEGWARLQYVEGDGYYLIGRDLANRTNEWYFQTVNEKDALCINLLPDDKIVLDIYDALGVPDEVLYAEVSGDISGDKSGDGSGESVKVYEPKTLTVEEYYNLSINNGYEYRTEDGYFINITNMSDDNIGDIGLDIKDGEIHVIGKYVGP